MLRSRKYGPHSAGRIARLSLSVMLLLVLAGCDLRRQAPLDGAHREAIQGFQATFYRVSDGKQRWIEVAIPSMAAKRSACLYSSCTTASLCKSMKPRHEY